jgi:hypothetical protein
VAFDEKDHDELRLAILPRRHNTNPVRTKRLTLPVMALALLATDLARAQARTAVVIPLVVEPNARIVSAPAGTALLLRNNGTLSKLREVCRAYDQRPLNGSQQASARARAILAQSTIRRMAFVMSESLRFHDVKPGAYAVAVDVRWMAKHRDSWREYVRGRVVSFDTVTVTGTVDSVYTYHNTQARPRTLDQALTAPLGCLVRVLGKSGFDSL